MPRIYGHVEKNHLKIKDIILTTCIDELADFWEIKVDKNANRIDTWIKLVAGNSAKNDREIKKWLTKLFK